MPLTFKNEATPLKSKAPFKEIILRKKKKKLNTVLLIKRHWKKMAKIPQKHDFLTWTIQNFLREVKQFVGKYYIT